MPARALTALHVNGRWRFLAGDQPVQGFMITVTDAESGSTEWIVISDSFTNPPIHGATMGLRASEDSPSVQPFSRNAEGADKWLVSELAAHGINEEELVFREELRPVSTFDYGVAPPGFRDMPATHAADLQPGRTYTVTVTGSYLAPVAVGSFVA